MADNWYEQKQNNSLGYFLMLKCLKILPSWLFRFFALFVGFFYWTFSKNARRFSRMYFSNLGRRGSSLKHIACFAVNLVEDVQSWAGKLNFSNVEWQGTDVHSLVSDIDSGKGAVIVISHLGNAQMLKGLASMGESGTKRRMSITTISDANISAGFNALLNQVNSDSSFHIVSSNDIGPETILLLQERLENGEVVVIAGDRVSAHTDRNIKINFLGKEANFPYGVFLMISLLNSPTYFVNGMRHKDFALDAKYDMYVKKCPVDFGCKRSERDGRIREAAERYARNLEELCRIHPYQWYNFFDFWGGQD